MINIGICDDNYIEISANKIFLEEYIKENNIDANITVYDKGMPLLQELKTRTFHIILLDIIMKNENGIEIAKEIRKIDSNVIIVFISSIGDYAIYGYDVDALAYFIKPLTKEKVKNIMEKAHNKLKEMDNCSVIVKTAKGFKKVCLNEVIYVESSNKEVYLKYRDREDIFKMKLDEVEEIFNRSFIRVHKSYLVNLNYINELNGNKVILESGQQIPVSRSFKDNAFERYISFIEGEE
ncbi:MAG: LytR/AlgR family response regulator transcription factor [Clostridium sp.]